VVEVKVFPLPPLPEDVEVHVVALTDRLLQVVRQALMAQDWGGLRNSHFRLLGCVPPAGTTISELSAVLFMTKQAVGQFVTQLQDTGHLVVRSEDQDRRRKIITRTAEGDRVVERVNATIGELEQQWSDLVGRADYRTFLQVLERIALDRPTA
jgi:DNA-binding MarR family transcriptional regulator